MSTPGRMGYYKGVQYIWQRICDVMVQDIKARWYFAYIDGKPTGDHFKTIKEFQQAVDEGLFG